MGEGVRELDDASEGEGVIEPSSSEAEADMVSTSDSTVSSTARVVRAVTTEAVDDSRRAARLLLLARMCFGAGGGLFAAGWNSMMGRRRCSQLYWRARLSPRSIGIHVPAQRHKLFADALFGTDDAHAPWYFPYPPCTFSCSPFCTSRSSTRVRCGLSNPATLRICVAFSHESERRRITATPLHILRSRSASPRV